MSKRCRRVRPFLERLDDRCLPSGLAPAQVLGAYGLGSIAFRSPSGATVRGDGSGETIALVEAYHAPNLAAELSVFDRANGLADPPLTVIDQAGGATNAGWAAEEALDVEWAHAIAPGAAILVVEARSDNAADLLSAVDTARSTPGVVAVSMSWGFQESRQERAWDAHFQTPAGHEGTTFVAASGDNGPGTQYPAASPYVLSVGGTSLFLNGSGAYQRETAWNGSGGGPSRFEPEPRYQRSVQAKGRRLSPDVAFLGDPNTGVAAFEAPPSGAPGSWRVVGGTSLGAPAWAAIIAIVDQGRALAGKPSLDGATQTLPALYGLPVADFHRVGAPAPAPAPQSPGFFSPLLHFFGIDRRELRPAGKPARARRTRPSARLGASSLTGLGTPNGPALIADLVASDLTGPLAPIAQVRVRARANVRGPSAAHRRSPVAVRGPRHHRPGFFTATIRWARGPSGVPEGAA